MKRHALSAFAMLVAIAFIAGCSDYYLPAAPQSPFNRGDRMMGSILGAPENRTDGSAGAQRDSIEGPEGIPADGAMPCPSAARTTP